MVVLVGDRPSSKNLDKSIAFVGTQSYKRLLRILQLAGLETFVLCNAYTEAGEPDHIPKGSKYVALGKNAAKRLKELSISCLELPHPSGKNRAWNAADSEAKVAQQLKSYLEEK